MDNDDPDVTEHPPPDTFPPVQLTGPAEAHRVPDQLRHNGEIPTWYTATGTFNRLVQKFEQEGVDHRAVDYDIFTASWAGAVWSELYEIDKKATDWAEQTVMFTFTASHYLDAESDVYAPPITFFHRLQSAAAARQKALSRCLNEIDRWQSVRVIGSGPLGYPVLCLGVYLSSKIEPDLVHRVVQAHVRNCELATQHAHKFSETITTRPSPTHRSKLINGIGRKIPGLKSNNGITAESWTTRGTATTLRAGQLRPYRFGRST